MATSESSIFTTLARVFAAPRYLVLSTFVAWCAISLIAFLPNRSLLNDFLSATEVSLGQKIEFVLRLYINLDSHMHPLSVASTLCIAVLLGINVSLLVYYIKRRRVSGKNTVGHAAGLLGVVAGVFGIGCAACGSLIIIGVLSTIGAAGLLASLPFGGAEFSVLGIGLLLFSISTLAKKIRDPLVCPR